MKKLQLGFVLGLSIWIFNVSAKDAVLDSCLSKAPDNTKITQCIEEAIARMDKRVSALGDEKKIAEAIRNEMRARKVKETCMLDQDGTSNNYKSYLCLIHSTNDVIDALETKTKIP